MGFGPSASGKTYCAKQIIDLIIHFYPGTEIEDNKFIYKYRCSLWDKCADIQQILQTTDLSNLSNYDIYEKYCKEQRKQNNIIVSKYFFEKFLIEWRE